MIAVFLLPVLAELPRTRAQVMTCYYNWNQPPLTDVDVSICSHIIMIGQLRVGLSGRLQLPPTNISEEFSALKKRRSDLKLLMCLTGPNEGFSALVVSCRRQMPPRLTKCFAADGVQTLHGLDVDWEFPTWSPDARKTDRMRFPLLLKALRERVDGSLLLTVAVTGPPTITRVAYDAESFNRYVDLVNVMNYDFHIYSKYHPFVGFNAPLRKLSGERGVLAEMNSESSMAQWKKMGLWSNKTVFGIPTYGRAFTLVNWKVYKPYSPASGALAAYNYPEACQLLRRTMIYRYEWNDSAASPYLHGTDKLWLSYEDIRSVRAKASYAKSLNIAGVMVYHIGSDDLCGTCGNGTFPLLRAIKAEVLRTSAEYAPKHKL